MKSNGMFLLFFMIVLFILTIFLKKLIIEGLDNNAVYFKITNKYLDIKKNSLKSTKNNNVKYYLTDIQGMYYAIKDNNNKYLIKDGNNIKRTTVEPTATTMIQNSYIYARLADSVNYVILSFKMDANNNPIPSSFYVYGIQDNKMTWKQTTDMSSNDQKFTIENS